MSGNNETDPEEALRMMRDSMRLLEGFVESQLLVNGWVVANVAADDEPLEFLWPPTMPKGVVGLPTPRKTWVPERPLTWAPQETPWTRPTRVARIAAGWRVEYGAAIAQEPDPPQEYPNDDSLLANLEAIQWWPMTVEEAQQIIVERVYELTVAAARNLHYPAAQYSEPYISRMEELRQRWAHPVEEPLQRSAAQSARAPLEGDLGAQLRLVEAEAWASAIRTARVG